MQTRAKFYEVENFGDEQQYNKGVFLDLDSMDKIKVMLSGKQVELLAPFIGKDGVLSIGLEAKGYDYAVKFKSFKAA